MSEIQHIKLSDLTRKIEKVISDSFSNQIYWVIAEINGLKFYPDKGYYFFDLVEKDERTNTVLTSIKANAWSTAVSKIKSFEQATGQKFDNNIQVLLKVSVEYNITYGLKVNFLDIDHSFTIGNLEKQRQDTLRKLLAENPEHIQLIDGEYITFNKQISINPVIQFIALISSANSDGYKDFKHELINNKHKYIFHVDEYLTQVQGDGVETQMKNKLIEIFNSKKQYDAVVIVRGGGAQADFLIFDSYVLSRAVARFPIPVITGIGHTKNESLVDLMAHRPTKTPTKAAESIIAHNRTFEEQVLSFQRLISLKTNELISRHQLLLNNVNSGIISKSKDILSENMRELSRINSTILNQTKDYLHHHKEQLSPLLHTITQKTFRLIETNKFSLERMVYTLQNSSKNLLEKRQYNLNYYISLIKHNSPAYVLKRGYALVYQDGKIVKDPKTIQKGSEITTLLYDTEIISSVKEKKQTNERKFEL